LKKRRIRKKETEHECARQVVAKRVFVCAKRASNETQTRNY